MQLELNTRCEREMVYLCSSPPPPSPSPFYLLLSDGCGPFLIVYLWEWSSLMCWVDVQLGKKAHRKAMHM